MLKGDKVTPPDSSRKIPLSKVKLLAPVAPSKIVCLGWNYLEHAREMKHELPDKPRVFLKPPSAVIGPGDKIVLPKQSRNVHHEIELAIVVGRRAKTVKKKDALKYIKGYTVMQDITARDLQWQAKEQGAPWSIAKGFDTFAPLGPLIVPKKYVKDPHNLDLELRVNDKVRQESNTRFMYFKVPEVIEYVSGIMTLEPDDVIATGTPEGVGPIKSGDKLEAEIEKIGVLRNTVK